MIVWLIRYGEIFLKGRNRNMFERRLVHNIKDCLKKNKINFHKISLVRNRILVYSNDDCSCLRNVFGIVSFSKAFEINQDLDEMNKHAFKFYKKGTFRISAQRLEKNFKYNSEQINKIVGAYIVKKKHASVKLKDPDLNIGIELFNKKAYVFGKKINALGGLPVGVEGNIGLLLEDENSILAGILMLKRGCSISLIQKKNVNCDLLKKFCYGFELKTYKNVPKGMKALAVNDALDNIKERNFKITVFRPLIGYKLEDVKKWLIYS